MTLIKIDENKCTKDNLCVMECPAGIIKQGDRDGVPALIDQGEKVCMRCGHCPVGSPRRRACLPAGLGPVSPPHRRAKQFGSSHFRGARPSTPPPPASVYVRVCPCVSVSRPCPPRREGAAAGIRQEQNPDSSRPALVSS